jgi:putative transposase
VSPFSVWTYGFVFDRCLNGQRFKSLTIVDAFFRECRAIRMAGSLRGERVIRPKQ